MNDPDAIPAPEPTSAPLAEPVPGPASVPVIDPTADAAPDVPPAVGGDGPAAGPASAGPSEAAPRRGRLAAVGIGVLVVALAFGAGIAIGRATAPGGESASPPVAAASPGAASPGTASPGSSAGTSPAPSGIAALPSEGGRLGLADAKVVVDYWADYQCPFCATFAQEVIPQLESRIADGTVALVHRDYAFLDWRSPGTESLDAAIAVRCAGRQGRYWEMHDAVYAAQAGENQGGFARDRLAQVATGVGVDAADFAACMDDREPMVEVLDDTAAATRAGINSTPTVEVNGQRFSGVSDVPALLAAIDAAAAGASPAPVPTAPPLNDPWGVVTTSGREAGDLAAPVTVELWMDYQASAAGSVADPLGAELRSRVTDGSIRIVQRDLATLGDESLLAAATVRCIARQDGPAWLIHDALAASGQGPNRGIFTAVSILRFASRLGLEIEALSDCLDDPSVQADVRVETAIGTGEGLSAAPAVIVRKGDKEVARFSGELDVAKILAAIDKAG